MSSAPSATFSSIGAWGEEKNSGTVVEPTEKSFDDNFAPEKSPYNPLPDTEDYIKTLESKLKKVQKSGSLSSNLSAKRLDDARRLLDSAAQSVNADLPPELIQDPQIQDNPLLRTIFPEKQAIAQSELTKLVKDSPIEEQKPIAENLTTTEPEIATEK